jgi:CYTH domain-containing protein
MEQIEVERKFIVKFESWEQVFALLDDVIAVKRIEQVYLQPNKAEPAPRIRKTIEGFKDKETYYDINQKKPAGSIAKKEKEQKISEKDYKKYIKYKDSSKVILKKTRIVFKYKNQIFELDLFKGPLKGLAILEIELKKKDQKVELPPYLKAVKEVSKEDKFNNFNLSDCRIKGYKNGKLIRH